MSPGDPDRNPLKRPAQSTISYLRLVDAIVLEGMGLPTAGFHSRSKLPTDPTAPLWRVSRSNLRGDADFLTTQLRLLRRLAARLLCAQEVRPCVLTQASPTATQRWPR